jgi:hypothetical protein
VGQSGSVLEALGLAENIQRVDEIEQAQVMVLNGLIPDAGQVSDRLCARTEMESILCPEINTWDLEKITGQPARLQPANTPLSLVPTQEAPKSIIGDISRGSPFSGPALGNRLALAG